jgi:hypothetical protein
VNAEDGSVRITIPEQERIIANVKAEIEWRQLKLRIEGAGHHIMFSPNRDGIQCAHYDCRAFWSNKSLYADGIQEIQPPCKGGSIPWWMDEDVP